MIKKYLEIDRCWDFGFEKISYYNEIEKAKL